MLLCDGDQNFVDDLIRNQLNMAASTGCVDRIDETDLLELSCFRLCHADLPSGTHGLIRLEHFCLTTLLLTVCKVEINVALE